MSEHFSELFPSLGYFGESEPTCLHIKIEGGRILGVRVSLRNSDGEFLNLKGILFERDGAALDVLSLDPKCEQSSFLKSDIPDDASRLLRSEAIHTASESHPWWSVRFPAPLVVTQLTIKNRGDRWGSRSRCLLVEVCRPSGEWKAVYFGQSFRRVLTGIRRIGEFKESLRIGPAEPLADFRARVVGDISNDLLAGRIDIQQVDWAMFVQLVPIWTLGRLSEDELVILAAASLAQSVRRNHLSILGFSFALRFRADILKVQDYINQLAQARSLGPWVVTRHGVQRATLLAKKDIFLASIVRVIETLAKWELNPMLCYGTLLGAVRDKEFIPHDDDVDLLYEVQADSPEAARVVVGGLVQRLRDAGYGVDGMTPPALNIHVQCPGSDATVDIFPCWRSKDGRAFLHMEKMQIRDCNSSILFPTSTVALYGKDFPAPADPGAFLTERYGASWSKSDPFFEWPWPLEAS